MDWRTFAAITALLTLVAGGLWRMQDQLWDLVQRVTVLECARSGECR